MDDAIDSVIFVRRISLKGKKKNGKRPYFASVTRNSTLTGDPEASGAIISSFNQFCVLRDI